MASFTDQTGRNIVLEKTPRRIVSLVPSQTELLYSLGLDDEVIAITKFCVHPATWFHSKTRIGGTKQLKLELIESLEPDLIIANKEENVKEQIEGLAENFPTWVSDINDLSSALDMIAQVGSLTGKDTVADELILKINTAFEQFPIHDTIQGLQNVGSARLRTVYLIWQEPYMSVGGDTFIHSMMEIAGFDNVFAPQTRYPELSIVALQNINPELILLASEPFPFSQKHKDELQSLLPASKIVLVDGEMFSWYGSRLLYAPAYFQKLWNEILNIKTSLEL